ncbi:AAA family ATPase [Streptomyces sp. NPDC001999]
MPALFQALGLGTAAQAAGAYRTARWRWPPPHPGGSGLVHRTGGAVVSATAPNPGRGRAGLLEKLLAAIRPEFRTEIYRPAADDPVFIVPPRGPRLRPRGQPAGLTSSTRPVGRGGVQRLVPAPTVEAARFAVAEGSSADHHRFVDSTVKLRQDRRMLRRERPLEVAVCGPPGAGKTTVACATARRLGVPFLTRDEIKLGLRLSSASVAKDGGVQLNLVVSITSCDSVC